MFVSELDLGHNLQFFRSYGYGHANRAIDNIYIERIRVNVPNSPKLMKCPSGIEQAIRVHQHPFATKPSLSDPFSAMFVSELETQPPIFQEWDESGSMCQIHLNL